DGIRDFHVTGVQTCALPISAIVRWPGVVPQGSTIDTTILNLDWFPTILAIAGLQPVEDTLIHGRNFLPILRGETIPWDERFYGRSEERRVGTGCRGSMVPKQ